MFKKIFLLACMAAVTACATTSLTEEQLAAIPDAGPQLSHVEPPSWWTGMKTSLQIMVHGEDVSQYDIEIHGLKGVNVKEVHPADNKDFLFVDVEIASNAETGTAYLVFIPKSDPSAPAFKQAYEIASRRDGSAQRKSFGPEDMIYLIMPDRFANGDPGNDSTDEMIEKADRGAFFGRHGGDIQGIIDHLNYISSLGATAIWNTPLLVDDEPESSYHGYACGDYYKIDPRYGSNELYREFVAKSHEKDLKVIMDIVPNHCGTGHWWMKNQPFTDWVHNFDDYTGTNVCFSTNMDPNASKHDLYLQESGWFVPSMPDMNLDNPFTLKYFQQWAIWWVEYADLDGLRVDTYPYNEKMPMSEWCKAVLAEYPNLNIVGECWTSSYSQLAYWQAGNENKDGFNSNLPSIMDFPLYEAIGRGLSSDEGGWGNGMVNVYDCLSHDFVYHDLSKMMIFVSNHDTERIGDVVCGDVERQKTALTLMATMRGIPQVLYGDEQMFLSSDKSQGHGGLRLDFPGGWAGDAVDLFTPQGRAEAAANTRVTAAYDAASNAALTYKSAEEVFNHASKMFNWRKTKDVIHHGRTMHFLSRDNTYAFFRYNDAEAVFVYVNNTAEPRLVPWADYVEMNLPAEGSDVLTDATVRPGSDFEVAPHCAAVVEFKF